METDLWSTCETGSKDKGFSDHSPKGFFAGYFRPLLRSRLFSGTFQIMGFLKFRLYPGNNKSETIVSTDHSIRMKLGSLIELTELLHLGWLSRPWVFSCASKRSVQTVTYVLLFETQHGDLWNLFCQLLIGNLFHNCRKPNPNMSIDGQYIEAVWKIVLNKGSTDCSGP